MGLMGIHEWLLKRGYGYEVTPELHEWLAVYEAESEKSANEHCDRFFISRPVAYRSIAPTGTIGILAATTTGIEPLFALAYKRRYLDRDSRKYQIMIDRTAQVMIDEYGLDPEKIETAYHMSSSPEQRIKFQADVQDYVDMAISSTINLPAWGTENNNEDTVSDFANVLSWYAPRLRGGTFYPDGARGGQPIEVHDYHDAVQYEGTIFEDNDSCKGGVCGI